MGLMDCSSFQQPCGWLSPRFVLQQRLNDGANDLVKYGAGSILLLMVSSSAFGAGQPTQCFSIEKNVRANGNGESLGYYRALAIVSETAGSALVSFSVSMPDTAQVLLGENIKATRVAPTTYKFRFVDGWGNHSTGLLTISGKRANLNLMVETFSPIPSNITRNYGESILNRSSCQ